MSGTKIGPSEPIKTSKINNSLLNSIEQSATKISNSLFHIFKIFIIFVIIFYTGSLFHWIYSDPGDSIIVQTFKTVGIDGNLKEETLSDLLRFELQKIKSTHEREQELSFMEMLSRGAENSDHLAKFSMPKITLQNEPLEYSISTMGSVGVGGSTISVGNFIFSMRELAGRHSNTVSCSIQKYNYSLIALASMVDHHSSDEEFVTWKVERTINQTARGHPTLKDGVCFGPRALTPGFMDSRNHQVSVTQISLIRTVGILSSVCLEIR